MYKEEANKSSLSQRWFTDIIPYFKHYALDVEDLYFASVFTVYFFKIAKLNFAVGRRFCFVNKHKIHERS